MLTAMNEKSAMMRRRASRSATIALLDLRPVVGRRWTPAGQLEIHAESAARRHARFGHVGHEQRLHCSLPCEADSSMK